ncbi:MlaA family lipoprotein [Profundibacter sp.]
MKNTQKTSIRSLLAVMSLVVIASCTAPAPKAINDPHEANNRRTHEANRRVDKALVRPASGAYGNILPAPVRQGVGNFASNLNLPGVIVNNLLQLNIDGAVKNTWRFVINTTVGLGGILDPSSTFELYEDSSDFGETLHVWGMGEGEYVELPFIGPSTQRDALGMVVDVFTNPLTFGAPSPERYMGPVVKGLSKLGDRYTYSSTVDAILYDSADSYAQARLLYLQSRRFQLGQEQIEEDQGDDGYDDFYAD